VSIVLRKPEPVDLDALYVQKNDPEVKRLLGGFAHPMSRRDLDEWLEFHRKRQDEVLWTIADEADDRCLGHIGLYKIDPIARSAELGIMIGDKAAWGKGIGTEATRQALKYAFSQMNLNRIGLTVLATNERAIRLYCRLGFAREGVQRQAIYRDGLYVDLVLMGLLRAEYEAVTAEGGA
jgi:[ribosomal protein S5]-alanine N-acetyltransferase